jgi:hypothetical protein
VTGLTTPTTLSKLEPLAMSLGFVDGFVPYPHLAQTYIFVCPNGPSIQHFVEMFKVLPYPVSLGQYLQHYPQSFNFLMFYLPWFLLTEFLSCSRTLGGMLAPFIYLNK